MRKRKDRLILIKQSTTEEEKLEFDTKQLKLKTINKQSKVKSRLRSHKSTMRIHPSLI